MHYVVYLGIDSRKKSWQVLICIVHYVVYLGIDSSKKSWHVLIYIVHYVVYMSIDSSKKSWHVLICIVHYVVYMGAVYNSSMCVYLSTMEMLVELEKGLVSPGVPLGIVLSL